MVTQYLRTPASDGVEQPLVDVDTGPLHVLHGVDQPGRGQGEGLRVHQGVVCVGGEVRGAGETAHASNLKQWDNVIVIVGCLL